jgi:glycosyltransferase involved in cell wall biosynthesis
LHGTEILDSEQYRVSKYIVKKAKYVICVSEEIEYKVKRDNPNVITYIVPCAVRDDFFVDNRTKKDAIVRIAFASAKSREVKNYPLFAEIISQLLSISLNEIQTIELDNKTREEILADLNEIDLLLMTSFHEGSPQIIKEALCCNTPIVSSNVGTVKYMLDGLTNCKVINGYDPVEYVNEIQKILQSSIPGFPIRSSGRKRIFELKYDEKSIASQVKQIYNDMVFH